ncbi:hypothetical protein DASC09_033870 [Saccharomycopsis crataegensis]|uniref:Major facilitator superfamily (MFS) profile domain-containing protein n=1 Tax=Saccharomycopsis crataegensis TaxID=43959 RepID=A0AAV5QN93_9ASCO|nr:hypothetical protein DASC09_033870 [Saccharomycopsis crataegensis]
MVTEQELQAYKPVLTGKTLLYFTSIFVSLGVFLFGYDQGVMGSLLTQPNFVSYFNNPSRSEIAIMVAILELGAFFSSLFVGRIGDVIGRRRTIRYGAFIFIIGGLIQTCAHQMLDLIFGRVISGIGVGILSAIVPVYQSEVSAPKNRGKMGCIQFTGNVFGYSTSIWIDYGCSLLPNDYSWRIPLSIQCIIGSFLFLGSYVIVETPRWLLSTDNDVEGLIVIANLHSKGDTHHILAKDEYQSIKKDVLTHRFDGEHKGYAYMWRKYKKRVVLGCLCLMFAQFNGINVICYYASFVFEQAGWHGRDAILMTGINSVIYVFCTMIPWFLVDKHGRRPILLAGAAIMFFSLTLMAFFLWLDIRATPLIIVMLVILFTGPGFGTSWGPIAWFIPSEVLPISIRSIGAGCATSANWFANTVVGEMTPILQEAIGWRLYLVHAFSCLCSFMFVLFFLPETAGVSLEDMNSVFGDGASSVYGDNASSYAPINDSDSLLGGSISGESMHENDRLYDGENNSYYCNHIDDEESLLRGGGVGSQSFISTVQAQRDPGNISTKPPLEFTSLASLRPGSSSIIAAEDIEPPSLEEVLRFKQAQEGSSIKGSIRRGSESVSHMIGKVLKRKGEGDDESFDVQSNRSKALSDYEDDRLDQGSMSSNPRH